MSDWEITDDAGVLRVLRREGAVRVELNRPESLNAFDEQLGVELRDTLDRLAHDDTARAIVLTGTGRAFSSGADIRQPSSEDQQRATGRVLRQQINPVILTLR